MSIKTAIYSLLKDSAAVDALVGARIYPLVAPSSADMPFVVYQRIATVHHHHLSAPAGLAEGTFQISVYARSSLEAWNVTEAVRNLLDGYTAASGKPVIQGISLQNEIDDYEKPTDASQGGTFSTKIDFMVWYEESVPTNT